MVTPDDLLALAGRSLHGRIRRAIGALPPDVLQRMDARLRRDARDAGLVYEREAPGGAVTEAIRVLPRPLCVLPDQMAYLHQVTLQLVNALKQLPAWYMTDGAVRDVIRVSDAEDAFIRSVWSPAHARDNPVYARLDAVFDPTSAHWRQTLGFVESNLSGVGGIHIAPVCEGLVMRDVVPMLAASDPGLALTRPRDQRELFLQLLLDHQRALGRGGGALCLLEPCYVQGGPVEQSELCKHLHEQFGVEMVHADPRDLRMVDGEVWAFDHEVDVVYRDYELCDLLALEAEHGPEILEPMRTLFRQNRVVSSIGAELDQKASFELLTDPVFADRLLSPEQRRLFARHVLWTRRLDERTTTLADGRAVDLVPWVRAEREHLVLKPNRGYGGMGIVIGSVASEAEWDDALAGALAAAGDPHRSYVVQQLTEIPVFEFPVAGDDGLVHDEPFYVVMGFAPTEGGLGNLCRVSQKQVVNVAQRGGVAAVLVAGEGAVSEAKLRGPARQRRGADAMAALRAEIASIRHLDAAVDLLGWDEETVLPPGARAERGEQLATLEALRHRALISPWLGEWLAEARAAGDLDQTDAVELAILARRRDHAIAVPDGLVRAFAEARSRSLGAWEAARVERRYAAWLPAFTELLGRVRERAQALGRSIPGHHPYDALLDEHDQGLSRATVGPVLRRLRDELVPLVDRLAGDAPMASWRRGSWPDADQDRFCRELAAGVGFDFDRGRLDRSTHPFTLAAGARDVRMTVRVDERDPLPAIFGLLHEVGHGLYDQGLAEHHQQRLVGTAPGMAIHEAQARLWENLVGRSEALWRWQLPKLRERFPSALRGVDLEAFLAEITRVRRSFVRVEADEVTYNLHIVVRYELEELLVDGHLKAEDLPAAWNQAMVPLAGGPPPDDTVGVLQDVHWAVGSFGYFPSYTLGNLYGAQLFEAWQRARPDGLDAIAAGDASVLRGWLSDQVYRRGHLLAEDELVRAVTGSGLDAGPFVRAIRARYGLSA